MSKATQTYADLKNIKDDVVSGAEKQADILSAKAQDMYKDLKEEGSNRLHKLEQYVSKEPVQSLGIAFAVGLLSSLILRRK